MSGTQRGPAAWLAGRAQAEVWAGFLSHRTYGSIFSTPLVLALTYVQSGHRCNAPFTPKVLLCGPLGSGKKLQAALLAQKYGLVDSKYLTKVLLAVFCPPRPCVFLADGEEVVTVIFPVLGP